MKTYVIISTTALPGKWAEAPKAALEAVQYLNNNSAYVGKYEILKPLNGPNKQTVWLCEYSSLADFEKDSELRGKDLGWHEVWAKIDETIDSASITSETLRVSA